jgi:hypothetical protein
MPRKRGSMKQTISLLSIVVLLSLVGCQDKPKEPTAASTPKPGTPRQTKIKNSTPAAQPTITLSHPSPKRTAVPTLGIVVDNGKIIIDTKQTKDFLQDISQKMEKSFKRIETNLRKEQISSPNETGIIITDTSVQIDFNKTKDFMEKWIRSMESVAKEIDDTVKEIEKSLPQR